MRYRIVAYLSHDRVRTPDYRLKEAAMRHIAALAALAPALVSAHQIHGAAHAHPEGLILFAAVVIVLACAAAVQHFTRKT